jgi:hypothetical protein
LIASRDDVKVELGQWVSSLSPGVNGSGAKSFVFKSGGNKESADPWSSHESCMQTPNVLEEHKEYTMGTRRN